MQMKTLHKFTYKDVPLQVVKLKESGKRRVIAPNGGAIPISICVNDKPIDLANKAIRLLCSFEAMHKGSVVTELTRKLKNA